MLGNDNLSNRERYQWINSNEKYPGVPPYVQGLPKGEEFSFWKLTAFNYVGLKALLGLIIAQVIHLVEFLRQKTQKGYPFFRYITGMGLVGFLDLFATFNKWENLEDFSSFFKPWTFLSKPLVADTWQEDKEFGLQRLVGLNPVLIQQCQPENLASEGNFPVTDQLLKPFLGDNFSLEKAFTEQRLYLVDYEIFDQIVSPSQEDQLGRYSTAPLVLLYVNEQQELIPIAIKLKRENNNKIFTPRSSPEEWLRAKMAVSATDIAYQGVVAHLLETHLISEVFAVATYRNFSSNHILYQLLKPHFFNTLVINFMGRRVFLGRGPLAFFDSTGALGYSGSNELLNRAYTGQGLNTNYQGKPWEFYRKAFPYRLQERNVDHDNLPGYYYRQDGWLIWNTIKDYVSQILRLHYSDVESLENDQQLQAWKNELISPNGGNLQGLLPPEKFQDQQLNQLEDLIEIITNLIFTVTAQHSAVNFGQYDYAAWVPNLPSALYQSLSDPIEEQTTKLQPVNCLPNRFQSIKQVVLMAMLSLKPPYSSYSLLTLKNPFKDDPEKQIFQGFKNDLREIENQLQQRNRELIASGQRPYKYLLPSLIPQSIAI